MSSYPGDRENDLRLLRQDAALEMLEHSPAIIKAEEEGEPGLSRPAAAGGVSRLHEWQPVLEFKAKHGVSPSGSSGGGVSGDMMAEWELLSPSRASVCGSSARSLGALERDEQASAAAISPRDYDAAAEGQDDEQPPPELADAMATHVTDASSTDVPAGLQADGQPAQHADEAAAAPIETSSEASVPESGEEVEPMQAVAERQQLGELEEHEEQQHAKVALDTPAYARSDISYEHIEHADSETVAAEADAETEAEAEPVVAAKEEEAADLQPPLLQAEEADVPAALPPGKQLGLNNTGGLDGIGCCSGKGEEKDLAAAPPSALASAALGKLASGVAGDALGRLWLWFNSWATAVDVGLNVALPRSGLNHCVAQARAQLTSLDWARVTLGTGVAVLGAVVVGCMVHNRRLSRSLRQKDREVAKLLMRILSLQDTLQGGGPGARRMPIVRHTAWAMIPSELM